MGDSFDWRAAQRAAALWRGHLQIWDRQSQSVPGIMGKGGKSRWLACMNKGKGMGDKVRRKVGVITVGPLEWQLFFFCHVRPK